MVATWRVWLAAVRLGSTVRPFPSHQSQTGTTMVCVHNDGVEESSKLCCLFFADSIYTERYMVTPSENKKDYRVGIVHCMMIDGDIMTDFSLAGFISVVSSQPSC